MAFKCFLCGWFVGVGTLSALGGVGSLTLTTIGVRP